MFTDPVEPLIFIPNHGVIFISRDFSMNLEKYLKVKVLLTEQVKIDL